MFISAVVGPLSQHGTNPRPESNKYRLRKSSSYNLGETGVKDSKLGTRVGLARLLGSIPTRKIIILAYEERRSFGGN